MPVLNLMRERLTAEICCWSHRGQDLDRNIIIVSKQPGTERRRITQNVFANLFQTGRSKFYVLVQNQFQQIL